MGSLEVISLYDVRLVRILKEQARNATYAKDIETDFTRNKRVVAMHLDVSLSGWQEILEMEEDNATDGHY